MSMVCANAPSPNNPTAPATHGVNNVDTTEMVEIKSAAAGQYRVIVTAKLGDTVKHPTQDFALVATSALTQAAPACGDNSLRFTRSTTSSH